jgi:DNA modification methylase
VEYERVGDGRHRLLLGDAAEVSARLVAEGLGGAADLVYIDPPFASQADYVHEARLDGRADGRVRRALAYEDTWTRKGGDGGVTEYLDALAPRLYALTKLLSPRGTLWVHLDWRAAYLARVLLDEMLGRDRFVNEIVWRRAPNLGRQAASHQFGRTLDTLLVYGGPEARLTPPTRLEPIDASAVRWDDEGRPFTSAPRGDYTDVSIAKLEAEGRVHRSATGRVYIKYFLVKDGEGRLCRERRVDALWTDVPPLRHAPASERTGYPTQKPRALLERIIGCATREGGLVVDLFAGSGTTAEVAHAMGRSAVTADVSPVSLATARARLLRAGAGLRIDLCAGRALPEAKPAHARAVRVDERRVRIALAEPNEPLAWAVGTRVSDFADADEGAPSASPAIDRQAKADALSVLFHAERPLGARGAPIVREGIVETDASVLSLRVYEDDGHVREQPLRVEDARGEGTTNEDRVRSAVP